MRHGCVRRESLLYVVVAATRPRYCGVLLVAALWLTAGLVCPGHLAAQKTKRRPLPPPFAALFPLEEAWMITLPALPAAPAAHDAARAYVPLASKTLVALDWQTGDTVWSVPLAATATPLPADGVIYVGAGDALHALDGATGARRWTAAAAGTILRLARTSGGQIVVAGASFAQMFEENTGKAIWSRTLPPSGDATGVALSDSTVFAAYGDGRLVALALSDGRDIWNRPIDGRPGPPLAHADSVYVGSTNNRFYALDAKDGDVRWSWRTGGDIVGAAADTKAVYYASLDAVVRAVNPGNGHQRWKRDGGTRPVAAPLILDGSLLVAGLSPALSG
ncbi:MAG TPA: PQQ-binding-like beta-propeller repeat protein, partial [Vicinamibacterales bacterium]|nr:PQQ-binding-like beta-propeller repeat protein [Vicinamibacterales bacterium]